MPLREISLPESQVLIYESKHPPGEQVPAHHHRVYQILYFLNGHGSISLEGKAYEVTGDQMVYIAPYSEHAVHAQSRMTVLVLAFGDFLCGLPGERDFFVRALARSKYQMLDPFAAAQVRDSFRQILYEQTRADRFSSLSIRSHLLGALVTIARGWEMQRAPDRNTQRANMLRHYIETRYFERLSAEDLAGMLKITPRHMNDIFKQQYHVTPIQYLTEVRVQRAKELLLNTDKEVVSICFEVGFETLSTFYRAFKRKVGVSPLQFRTMQRSSVDVPPP